MKLIDAPEFIAEVGQRLDIARAQHTVNPRYSLSAAEEIFTLTETLGYPEGAAASLVVRALAWLTLGNPFAARQDFQNALQRSRELSDARLTADSLHGLGLIHFLRAEYADSLRKYQEALALWDTCQYSRGQIIARQSLSEAYAALDNLPEAIECLKTARDIAQRTGEHRMETTLSGTLGLLLQEAGAPEVAIMELQNSLTQARQRQETYPQLVALTGLCEAYTSLGDYDEAETQGMQAAILAQAAGNAEREALAWQALGSLYIRQDNVEKATLAFMTALSCSRSLPNGGDTTGIYLALGQLAERRGAWDAADTLYTQGLEGPHSAASVKRVCALRKSLDNLHDRLAAHPELRFHKRSRLADDGRGQRAAA